MFDVKFIQKFFLPKEIPKVRKKRHMKQTRQYLPCMCLDFVLSSSRMERADGKKKGWADKIAFFGLFIASLFIAYLIVARRSAILFSEPIELPHMGVSVSVPVGNGWDSDKKWNYEENGFTTGSFFNPGFVNPIMSARCRYLLAAAEEDADTQFEQKARKVGGKIIETGQISSGPAVVNWAHITGTLKGAKTPVDIFFGTVQSPENRQLNIEVQQTANHSQMASEVFRRIVKGLEFKDAPLLAAGSKVVTEIKTKQVSSFLTEHSLETFFVVKDSKGAPAGFIIGVVADVGQQTPMNIQAANFLYIPGVFTREQVVLFQSRDDLSEFTWKSEVSGRFGRSGSEAVFDKSGVLAVKRYDSSVFSGISEEGDDEQSEEHFYRPGPASIPDVIGDFVFGQMFDFGYEKILIDLIRTDGTIVPVLMHNIESTDADAAYVVKVEFLDGRNYSEEVYFDEHRQVVKEVIRQDKTYILERSSTEELLVLFPEKAGSILQTKELFKSDG